MCVSSLGFYILATSNVIRMCDFSGGSMCVCVLEGDMCMENTMCVWTVEDLCSFIGVLHLRNIYGNNMVNVNGGEESVWSKRRYV